MRKGQTRDSQTKRRTRGHRDRAIARADLQLIATRELADRIARVMRFFPSVMRTMPPTVIDIDVVYSLTRKSTQFHLPATHPREESVG